MISEEIQLHNLKKAFSSLVKQCFAIGKQHFLNSADVKSGSQQLSRVHLDSLVNGVHTKLPFWNNNLEPKTLVKRYQQKNMYFKNWEKIYLPKNSSDKLTLLLGPHTIRKTHWGGKVEDSKGGDQNGAELGILGVYIWMFGMYISECSGNTSYGNCWELIFRSRSTRAIINVTTTDVKRKKITFKAQQTVSHLEETNLNTAGVKTDPSCFRESF